MNISTSLAAPQDSDLFNSRDSFSNEQSRTQRLVKIVAGLAVVALALASYLTWATWSSTPVLGCDSTGLLACDHVLSSPWSKWLGLPVSLFGALVYVGILVSCLRVAKRDDGLAWTALMSLSLLAAGSALWFMGLQAVVLGSFCLYCLGVHACGLAIGGLMVLLVREMGQGDNEDQMRMLLGVADAPSPRDANPRTDGLHPLAAAGTAAVGLAILMTGQFFFQPAGLVLKEVAAEAPPVEPETVADEPEIVAEAAATLEEPVQETTEPPGDTEGASTANGETVAYVQPQPEPKLGSNPASVQPLVGLAKPSRVIAFKGLNEPIDVYQVPILGNPAAEHIIVEMIDYTCTHCRHFHPNIHAALDRYGDQLAFVVQHVPLSKKCNPHVFRDSTVHKYACDYARLALGVWKLKPSKFAEYHDWLMKSDKPPSVYEARVKAMRLAGDAVLLDQNLKANSFRSFAGNSEEVQQLNAGLPVLLTEFGAVLGAPRDQDEWFAFLEKHFKIKPVSADAD